MFTQQQQNRRPIVNGNLVPTRNLMEFITSTLSGLFATQTPIRLETSSTSSKRINMKHLPKREALNQHRLIYIFATLLLLLSSSLGINELCRAAEVTSSEKQPQQEFELNCEPGEQRHFNYESSTRVWGSSSQQVYLRATMRLSCMEPPSNSTLKYLAEVLSVSGDFGDAVAYKKSHQFRYHPSDVVGKSATLKVEPVLEEVGEAISEAADRLKRSVSGWFNKTWGSVKDFFVNIFTSSEKSTVSREDAFRESGIDISSQCRGKKTPSGLPIDDSVFDDLEPKYYIGASTDSFRASYDFDDHSVGSSPEEDAEATISFFDDPKPPVKRSKRATSGGSSSGPTPKRSRALSSQFDLDHERLLRLPFVFVQSRAGRVLEVRFSGEESDLSVKNFKRHLCDLFATNLDSNRSQTNEVSPVGQHTTRYIVDPTLNSSFIRQSLLKSASMAGGDPTKLLVKALGSHQQHKVGMAAATTGMGSNSEWSKFEAENNNSVSGGGHPESRDPSATPTNGSLGDSLSVLRSINSTTTLQLNSKGIAPDIDRIQVRVKQVQQINEGRMVGSTGQLGMSLVQSDGAHLSARSAANRVSRSLDDSGAGGTDQLEDIADLLKVSTSFTVTLVPLSRLGVFSDGLTKAKSGSEARTKRSSGDSSASSSEKESSKESNNNGGSSNQKPSDAPVSHSPTSSTADSATKTNKNIVTDKGNNKTSTVLEPLVIKPDNQQQLQRSLAEWRQLEQRLQLKPSSLLAESSGQDGQLQRLEILRDQIQMRLNEEFMRNRLRPEARASSVSEQVAGPNPASSGKAPTEGAGAQQVSARQRNDLGLGLTQLILDSGVTAKRKGSVYGTLEEVLELEMALDEDTREGSVSRLMRDTVRIDRLRSHCKSAIATMDEIRAPAGARASSTSPKVEIKSPFGVLDDEEADLVAVEETSERVSSRMVGRIQARNRRKLDQCKQVVQLLLRVSDKQVADLVLELMDECNRRMLAGAKHEELGHGPASRYYRSLRQQFTELLANVNRPTEPLLDKLLARLHYSKFQAEREQQPNKRRQVAAVDAQQEFTYVSPTGAKPKGEANYNKSLLREEDNFNNDEGLGSLVMTITTLAAKPSIGRPKRVEIVEKLLQTLKGSSCSLFNGPDLDILESMGNFQEPIEELVGKVVHLARRCRHQDQYLVACVHGLQGQLRHPTAQRFLVEQLRSSNGSCTVKSEIVLTLIGAILVDELQTLPTARSKLEGNQIPSDPKVSQGQSWPSVGLNQVDDTLLELVDESPRAKQKYAQDRKCLKQLVSYYMSKKRPIGNDIKRSANEPIAPKAKRSRRAVRNDDNFWDEANCKRWALPDPDALAAAGGYQNSSVSHSDASDLLDEIDDNSILLALANNNNNSNKSGRRAARRNQKLIEREAELPPSPSNSTGSANTTTTGGSIPVIRRRHKCTASKSFGPKNAEATLRAEIVNDLVGARDENKFLARFRLATNFLGNRIDIGRMYLWHQRHTTRAHVNILGKSLWDTSHGCEDKAPKHLLYMPLFDFNLWLVKVSVGLRLHSEMGFFSNCDSRTVLQQDSSLLVPKQSSNQDSAGGGQLELYPTMSVRASGEASAKFVVARAGMSLASQYGYQGSIRVSQQPESCMSIQSAHQPMNITFASWFQLWDSDCHYWGSRNKAEPQATRWRLLARKPSVWLEDECLTEPKATLNSSSSSTSGKLVHATSRSLLSISP